MVSSWSVRWLSNNTLIVLKGVISPWWGYWNQ